ncbi:MAG: histidine kinase [Alphaproteobacteria bacterium]|nr:histidine kinase [Alphaproteobacteria bacterium]
MLQGWIVVGASFLYLSLLFAIAYWGDRRADQGRSVIATPYIYALSIAVYCTSWTFYGSVGRASSSGPHFLPIYLGPTLMACLWWIVLRKMVRISKRNRITSIADFISSRYGKSTLLGGLVTVIAVVGIMPYISLQLKAVSTTFNVLLSAAPGEAGSLFTDTSFYVALSLAAFSILFGTRHIDASEHHEGMVAAIAFESVVKLIAFVAVGVFVVWGVHDGWGDLFGKAALDPAIAKLFTIGSVADHGNWVVITLLSMVVIICLPRQFQVAVVENVDETHIRKAVWLFPLYLVLINLFVLPIAVAGLMRFPGGTVHPDTFVLALPMAHQFEALALFAFIGGLSAATGMIIVETVALSTMVCNDLVMPVLLRLRWLKLHERSDLSRLLLAIRRGTIVLVVYLGYLYVRLIGESFALVTIGLVSFAAAAQFAPAMLGGMFWKGATQKGAFAGLTAGFLIWMYTLLLPSFARSGWLPESFLDGPFGIGLLEPYALFGLSGLDHVTHSLIWSMIGNLGAYVMVSLLTQQSAIERIQASLFVDAFRGDQRGSRFWRGSATVADLTALVVRFVGAERAERAFARYGRTRGVDVASLRDADADLVNFVERLLAGAIGAASARVMVASVAQGEIVGLHEVMEILDEASQVIAYSQQLETKSRELEIATEDLRDANERLKELDRLKDEFISTVTHELRTPLTSIRSFSEILHDNPEIDPEQRQQFLMIIVRESERLTRLINQVLDLAKIESGNAQWDIVTVDPRDVIRDAAAATGQLFKDKAMILRLDLPDEAPVVRTDRDRLMQVVINLLSNAVKFCEAGRGEVTVRLLALRDGVEVCVGDNGPGIPLAAQSKIFEKFQQVGDTMTAKPEGTGLGLAICRSILNRLGGSIRVESTPGRGATFCFFHPLEAQTAEAAEARPGV